ncbi:MAG: DNA repair protein [Chitinophagaceae bacterium]|nr:MAG: DNA repair protein [Chitinophagaceae bacterium]
MESTCHPTDWTQITEIQLVYKSPIPASQRPKIVSAKETYSLLLANWNGNAIELQEEFKVLLMNTNNRVLGIYNATVGGLTSTTVDVRLILTAALKSGAVAIILAHNHPSGSLQPSREDMLTTERIIQAAQLHNIKVLDHLIMTTEGYYSFADEGVL